MWLGGGMTTMAKLLTNWLKQQSHPHLWLLSPVFYTWVLYDLTLCFALFWQFFFEVYLLLQSSHSFALSSQTDYLSTLDA